MRRRHLSSAAVRRVFPVVMVLAAGLGPAIPQTATPGAGSNPVPVGTGPSVSIPLRLPTAVLASDAAVAHGVRMKSVGATPEAPVQLAALSRAKTATAGKAKGAAAKGTKAAAKPARGKAAAKGASKPAPQLAAKPKLPLNSNMVQAFMAANKGDWAMARMFAEATGNAVFNTLIQWRYLVESGTGASFEEIDSFLKVYPNWPRRDALLAAAERTMPSYDDPRRVIDWYGTRAPATTIGKIRLGEALIAAGEKDKGAVLIRAAWVGGVFSPTDEYQILATHSALLTLEDHRARLDQLLARDDLVGARAQYLRVDDDSQRLAAARMEIKANPNAVQTAIEKLPESLRKNPELLFDAARAYRRRGMDNEAWTTLAQINESGTPLALADERWSERHIMTRDAVKAHNYQLAYDLVTHHSMQSGTGFAEAEFLAGWIALRFLHKPQDALPHFEALAHAVTLPISKARAYYWLGRAEEELDRPVKAIADYREAALHRETFYGQLALSRIDDNPVLALQAVSPASMQLEKSAFEADARVVAIRLLADLNDRERMRLFAIRVANDPAQPARLQMLAQLMVSLGDPAMGVRVAKLASYNGVVLASHLAPTMNLPSYAGKGTAPEAALVLGLTRQESEFDPKAVSSAGARGLMQLMPGTAKKIAQTIKIPYRPNDLTTKPEYNLQLGAATLADYLDKWGGSYVLGIASYNAGAGNVTRWVEANGDPRDPNVDPIDWIEMIPFAETRNYVQRVLENIEVYHSRLGGTDKLTILANLNRPNLPRLMALKDKPAAGTVTIERFEPTLGHIPQGQPVTAP